MNFTVEQALNHPVIRDASKRYENEPIDLAAELQNPDSLLYKSVATLVGTQALVEQITLQQQTIQQLITQQRNALNDIAINTSPTARTPDVTFAERQQIQEQQALRLLNKGSGLKELESQKKHLQAEIESLSTAERVVQSNLAHVEQQQREIIASVLGVNSNKTAEQIDIELNDYNSAQTTETELKTVSRLLRSDSKDELEKSVVSNEGNLLPTIIAQLSKLKIEHIFQRIESINIQIAIKLTQASLISVEDLLAYLNKPTRQTAPMPNLNRAQENTNKEDEDEQTTASTPFSVSMGG